MTLTGIARFIVKAEIRTDTPYRLCRIDFEPYAKDLFVAPNFRGTNEVDLKRVIDLLENVRGIKIDKRAIESASVADVVDILAMQLQFGAKEKQALLEATDTAARCEMLIAIAELEIAEKAGIRHKLQ